MNKTKQQLNECFSLVFPILEKQEIQSASVINVEDWDSLASVNIIAIIEAQFKIEIQPDELENLTSYQEILNYIQEITTSND